VGGFFLGSGVMWFSLFLWFYKACFVRLCSFSGLNCLLTGLIRASFIFIFPWLELPFFFSIPIFIAVMMQAKWVVACEAASIAFSDYA
jgi:hypothetical protein